MPVARRLAVCLCTVLLCASGAFGQNLVPPAAKPSSAQIPADTSAENLLPESERMVVSVDVVEVYFNVRAGGRLVQGLPKDEFEVLENGRREPVRYFSSMSEQPLRIGLMIDSSGSQNRVLEMEKEVAGKFFDRLLSTGDEAMVVAFDSGVELKQDFTGSPEQLRVALSGIARVSAASSASLGDRPARGRSTALYDAIREASERKMGAKMGRKVLIILTDGEDMGSRAKADDAITAALRSDAICYVLLIADSDVSSRKSYQGENKMRLLAERTGGRLIRVSKGLTDLEKRFDEISLELRNHYSVGYTPQDRRSNGEYRTLTVKSRRGFKVQARQGYYAKFGK